MDIIWAFIVEKILGPLGLSVLTEKIKDLFQRVFRRKDIQKEKQQREETYTNVLDIKEKVYTLSDRLISDQSSIIRTAASELHPLIEKLHIKTAHNILSNLRKDVVTEDRKTLARIDYYRGCCSRFIDKERSIAEFHLAYQEMVDLSAYNGGFYDPDIIAGEIYALCLKKEKDNCLRMAAKLKEVDRTNIWGWIPDLLFSEHLEESYNKLPCDLDRLMILANSCQLGNNERSLGVDISSFVLQTPDNISYENIPLWLFYLSVLTNRYIPEWNANAFMAEAVAGPACREYYEVSSRFLSLISKTELGEISPDVRLFNLITCYSINKNADLLPELQNCQCSQQFVVFKHLSYVLFLVREDRFEEAKAYLSNPAIPDESSVYNIRFYLSVISADSDYALESLTLLVEKGIEMPGQMLVFLLISLHDHYGILKELAGEVKVTGEINAKVYNEILKSLGGAEIDTQLLLENKSYVDFPIRPFVAIALNSAGETIEALDLSESCVRDGYVDFCSNIYFSLLKQSHSYARLNTFLKTVREKGFTGNPIWLAEEYALASKEEDFPRMLEIATVLYHSDPKNTSYFVCLISMQYQNGLFDKVKEMSELLSDYQIPEKDVAQVFNVLLLSDLAEDAVEFLFNSINSLPFSEGLNLLFHEACMNPKTGPIIRRDYRIVEEGLYVTYKHNGETLSDIIIKGQRTTCMLGKQTGDTVLLQDRMGREETYEIISIHNKYYKLLEKVYKDIHENKYTSAFSFSIEDLQPDNLLASLAKATGRDEGWALTHQQMLEDYKNGKQTIFSFFAGEDLIADFYNHLFGSFKVYSVQVADFNLLYNQREINYSNLEFVLDLPAVILMYEIQLRFNLNYHFPIIVSQGIVNLLEDSIAKEKHSMPAGIYQTVADLLPHLEIEEGETWYLTRLRGILKWIKEKTTIEVAHEMVELDTDTIFDKSRYMTVELQSVLLTKMKPRAFVSVDLAMILAMGKSTTVTDVNYLLFSFCKEYYGEVSSFLLASNIYGCNLDVEYVLSQYEQYKKGEFSSFPQCRENMSYCPSLYPVALGFCSELFKSSVTSAADRLMAESLLTTMFLKFKRQTALSILTSSVRQSPHIKQILLAAYKAAFPIVL